MEKKRRKSPKPALFLILALFLSFFWPPLSAGAHRPALTERQMLLFNLVRALNENKSPDPQKVLVQDLLLLISCRLMGEHLFDGGTVLLEPACVREGERLFRCRCCGQTKTEAIPALGHKWSDWVEVMPADLSDEGELARFCVREHCTAIERQILPKLTPTPAPSPTPAPVPFERGTILPEISGGIYRVLSPTEVTLLRSAKEGASFRVPDTVSLEDTVFLVTAIAPEAFASKSSLTDLYIGRNVVYIGERAFMACSHLERIFVEGSEIRSVGRGAFLGAGSDVEKMTVTLPAACEERLMRAFREAGLRRNTDVESQ